MSKSAGNGVDPVDIIEIYGADALRYTLALGATETQDLRMPVEKLKLARRPDDQHVRAVRAGAELRQQVLERRPVRDDEPGGLLARSACPGVACPSRTAGSWPGSTRQSPRPPPTWRHSGSPRPPGGFASSPGASFATGTSSSSRRGSAILIRLSPGRPARGGRRPGHALPAAPPGHAVPDRADLAASRSARPDSRHPRTRAAAEPSVCIASWPATPGLVRSGSRARPWPSGRRRSRRSAT